MSRPAPDWEDRLAANPGKVEVVFSQDAANPSQFSARLMCVSCGVELEWDAARRRYVCPECEYSLAAVGLDSVWGMTKVALYAWRKRLRGLYKWHWRTLFSKTGM